MMMSAAAHRFDAVVIGHRDSAALTGTLEPARTAYRDLRGAVSGEQIVDDHGTGDAISDDEEAVLPQNAARQFNEQPHHPLGDTGGEAGGQSRVILELKDPDVHPAGNLVELRSRAPHDDTTFAGRGLLEQRGIDHDGFGSIRCIDHLSVEPWRREHEPLGAADGIGRRGSNADAVKRTPGLPVAHRIVTVFRRVAERHGPRGRRRRARRRGNAS